MKKIIILTMMSIFLLFVYGCRFSKNIILPEYTEFSIQEDAFYYELNSSKYLTADINVCTTRFELVNYEGDKVKVEVFYDDQGIRDKINFSFNDDDLKITKTNQNNNNCSFINKIDSYVRISLPSQMNYTHFDINAYNSFVNLNQIKMNQFTYEHVNGNVKFSGEIQTVDVNIINGGIEVDHLIGQSAKVKTINGNITFNNSEIKSKLDCDLSNGNITINEGHIDSVETNVINGNITLKSLQNLNNANVVTTNGRVELSNINHETIDSIVLVTITGQTTNGSVKLNNVYAKNVHLKTVNGDISYSNENKFFHIEEVTYQKVNGDTSFNINGNIIKR